MFKNKNITYFLFGFGLILALTVCASAQTRKRKSSGKSDAPKAAAVTKSEVSEKTAEEKKVEPEIKKNARPESANQTNPVDTNRETVKTNVSVAAVRQEAKPIYFYEFSHPEFTVRQILLEHDENGKGKITFRKKDFTESVSDPFQLSPAYLEKLKALWEELNFFDSTENYQSAKDFSHLGTINLAMRKNGRERKAQFNWTENKTAKALSDEYRKIGQQFIWIFDISVARENQPLESPRLLDTLDMLVRRKEIADGAQMIPLLKDLNNDERIPLIARNHAARLISQIEKSEKKKEDKK